MFKVVLYYASIVVAGGLFAVLGIANLNARVVDPGSVMMVLGGIGLIAFAGYRLATADDPARHVPTDGWVWAIVVAAVLFSAWTVLFSPVSA
ncbi:hypothetical protein [Natronobacterium gregoryi]|uniref:Uncharacterized protein n=2 Tax=Natronobacterium gregoryi TaxID=44930 RepID=L0AK59_NATGS|nr:hypothetical protein [Natronobacterium gregoryi]AFZ73839.1 hypothetical protein Natgr_2690 [Natronobacterium gregoryi SP2]ELY65085.1 hypothetical protein C490_13985 [Natronobacterium gregoryi SP2]PLK19705.1 hypothetical protein CYV19_13405 [Natronobacterium gregoryi SP2]SFJ42275.1 hypothetical protein SAMN05443661_12828 [Natronobacterium gregoryi]